MTIDSSNIYDLIYSFKDYKKEASEITSLIKSKHPQCRAILDVGCGTAEHHKYLKNEFTIDGLDINEEFIRTARTKNQAGTYYVGDMVDFDLNRKYDAILCLFSAIGYITTIDKVVSALKRFNEQLKADGLILVEPWITPDKWRNGHIHMVTYDKENTKICRMSNSESDGNLSIMNFHYLIGTPAKGVTHVEERHVLALYSQKEMLNAFKEAGLDVTYDEPGLTGRGMYIATKKPA